MAASIWPINKLFNYNRIKTLLRYKEYMKNSSKIFWNLGIRKSLHLARKTSHN